MIVIFCSYKDLEVLVDILNLRVELENIIKCCRRIKLFLTFQLEVIVAIILLILLVFISDIKAIGFYLWYKGYSKFTLSTLQQGKAVVIDDSFEFEYKHNGSSVQILLMADFWHPDVPQWERETLYPVSWWRNTIYIPLQISNFKTVFWNTDYSHMIKPKTRRLSLYHNILQCTFSQLYLNSAAWKVSVFRVFPARIFPHSDWIRRDNPYLSVFSPNARKYGPEKLRIRKLFTQWKIQFHCQINVRIWNFPLPISAFSHIRTEYRDLLRSSPY